MPEVVITTPGACLCSMMSNARRSVWQKGWPIVSFNPVLQKEVRYSGQSVISAALECQEIHLFHWLSDHETAGAVACSQLEENFTAWRCPTATCRHHCVESE